MTDVQDCLRYAKELEKYIEHMEEHIYVVRSDLAEAKHKVKGLKEENDDLREQVDDLRFFNELCQHEIASLKGQIDTHATNPINWKNYFDWEKVS